MNIVEHLEDLPELQFPVVTIGMYDGVHYGHCKILNTVSREAKQRGGESIVLTFWPHPRFVLGRNSEDLKLLSTIEEKTGMISGCGIDHFIKLPFTREFSELSSEQFIKNILVDGIGAKLLIIGHDHRFGRDREGSFEYLQTNKRRFGFEIKEISRQDIDQVTVSSSKIRKALNSGEISIANEYLGREYSIKGIVTKGEQLGRKIGFPTANIYVPYDYKLIPADGVYVVRVNTVKESLFGMLNIGNRPTVEGSQRTIEVNIFDFNEDIYGLEIEVSFIDKLRDEIKFNDLNELEDQLKSDRIQALEILKK